MLCKNCGAQLEDGSKFCGECGTKVDDVNIASESVNTIDNSVVEPVVNNQNFEQVSPSFNSVESGADASSFERSFLIPSVSFDVYIAGDLYIFIYLLL